MSVSKWLSFREQWSKLYRLIILCFVLQLVILLSQFCVDINECTINTDECDNNFMCINNIGSYECQCRSGFQLSSDKESCTGY